MSSHIAFDGIRLDDHFEVAEIELPFLPGIGIVAETVPGRPGEARLGKRYEPIDIKVRLRLNAGSRCPVDIKAKWAEKAAIFAKDGPRPLSLGNGKHYMAEVAGTTEIDVHAYYGDVGVTFHCSDPIAFGAERAVTIPSGGSATFVVGGSYPTSPVIDAESAVISGSSLVWGVKLDEGEFVHVATGSGYARHVVADCAARTCTVAGSAAMITLDSDWLVLEPGEHTVRNDQGTGACTLTFTERWLA